MGLKDIKGKSNAKCRNSVWKCFRGEKTVTQCINETRMYLKDVNEPYRHQSNLEFEP